MDVFSAFVLMVATAAACVLLMQAYAIYENFDSILEFNDEYASLEYAKSLGGAYVDRHVFDPNDGVADVRHKWRCAPYGNAYVSASAFGFYALQDGNPRTFSTLEDCIEFTFTNADTARIVNPCTDANGARGQDCRFLKSIL
ncbi:IMV membrane protein [Equine molluscum contagiosum-like virus]|nr:IMV membrane protein [Equine molluscum contagiosum-like virus]